ncbi:SCO-spondin-like isoform X3 [Gigantopelta aegis]|uniref:SCO-spondin-like isoform X3 n=1 Tax=Gigantopelta aegis TaxID=1735272 RepID=UPI001B88888B|nr:SCO-spondin-like isoform X3 [Gigantopelta aegis]
MDPVNETCGRKIKFATEKWLTLSTPGMYSRGPRLRSSCNWLIKTLPGKHVLLRVEKLTLDCWRQMACDEDYIAIRYKTNLALPGPRFCCDRPTKTFVSHGNQILLLYRIGDLYMNRGVRVAFKIEKCGGCTANSTTAQPACLETRERNCDAQYTAACVKDRTKKCNYTRKNNCLDTIKKCCTGYKLTGSECRPTAKWSEWSTSSTVCSVTCGNGTLTVTRTRKCSTGPGHCKGNSTATLNKPCSMKSCPVNGLWSTWKVTSTEPCTLTCGGGVIRIHRSRTCIPPMFGGADCQGLSQDIIKQPCNINPCPIDGVWSEWRTVSIEVCSVTCGGGVMEVILERTCTAPKFGGKDCQGDKRMSRSSQCNTHSCPVDGVWTEWKTILSGTCSVTCGGGVLVTVQERTCIAPKYGGKACQGNTTETRSKQCNSQHCPVDGVWSEWRTVSPGTCSVTCGRGVIETVLERTCIGPKFGGNDCQGNRRMTRSSRCNSKSCPVDGVWSEWRTVTTGSCSVTCGGGVMATVLERTCIGPRFGGKDCQGNKRVTRTKQCNTHICSVDGVWSEWRTTSIGSCSVTCGGGVMQTVLERTCIGPSFGGKDCQGEKRMTRSSRCNTQSCPVDGVWSEWRTTSIGSCSVTCGGGVIQIVLERTCIGPKFGGKDCQGNKRMSQTNQCNSNPCPVDGVWSEWRTTSIGSCSVTCGGGVMQIVLERTCIGPKFGGKDCQGNRRMTRSKQCNTHLCSVDGVWSEWRTTSIGSCSVTCGGGVMEIVLERTCIGPSFGGKDCQGNKRMTRSSRCNSQSCPVDGVWTGWRTISIGLCSVTCGGGVMETILERTCVGPKFGGKDCQGSKRMSKTNQCNSNPCPVDGVWSEWRTVSIGSCSVTCGGGVMQTVLERTCIGPTFGGKDCQGNRRMTRSKQCNTHICSVDGVWSEWRTTSIGSCSVSCGGGVMQIVLERTCIGPSFGGKDCQGNKRMTRSSSCNSQRCPVDGVWSEWKTISTGSCSVTCGGGVKQAVLERTCIGPSFGGKDCGGEKRMIRSSRCNSQSCPADGVWSEWRVTSTGPCSLSCGGGVMETVLERTCIRPSPGGNNCQGDRRMTRTNRCNLHPCPVDGVWSEWKTISSEFCSVTCGGGARIIVLERTCIGPSFGGKNCQGNRRMTQSSSCNSQHCPVDGVWTDWKTVTNGSCSVTCGVGKVETILERTCIGPKFGGKDCQGQGRITRSKMCELDSCPADGVWSKWRLVSNGTCSVTCGGGYRETTLERSCIPPRFGGKGCEGDARKTVSVPCNSYSCSRDGQWGAWKVKESVCSVSCGRGTETTTYTRTCDSPPPTNGGRPCVGNDVSVTHEICVLGTCPATFPPIPVDGQWGTWTEISFCSVTCGKGIRVTTRERHCKHPAPQFGGKICDGGLVQIENTTSLCDRGSCTVDGGWGPWEVLYSSCSQTCGLGRQIKKRHRKCDNPAPQNGGSFCPGGLLQGNETSIFCHLRVCKDGVPPLAVASILSVSYTVITWSFVITLLLSQWL